MRQRGIAKYFNLRACAGTVIVYAYYVEPPWARKWKLPQIFPCDLCHFPPFISIYSRFGGLYIHRCSSFNFHKTKYILIPPDQVDFAMTAWRTEIASHDNVAQFPEMKVCVFFTSSANLMALWAWVRRQQPLGEAVERANHKSGHAPGKHSF
jgi:hypothetical protein